MKKRGISFLRMSQILHCVARMTSQRHYDSNSIPLKKIVLGYCEADYIIVMVVLYKPGCLSS